jgi:hypothetical protein
MSGSTLRSFEYLEGLPGTVFNRLYQQPSTALAIFRRMLPHLGMDNVPKFTEIYLRLLSQDLCYGHAVYWSPFTGSGSRILGTIRQQTVCKTFAYRG